VCFRVAGEAITIDLRDDRVYSGLPINTEPHAEAEVSCLTDLLLILERRISPGLAILQRRLKLRGDVGLLRELGWLWPSESGPGHRRPCLGRLLARVTRGVHRALWRGTLATAGGKAMHRLLRMRAAVHSSGKRRKAMLLSVMGHPARRRLV
jgi:hypothetical protein